MNKEINNYNQTKKQDIKLLNEEDFFERMTNESNKTLKRALCESLEAKNREITKKTKDTEMPPLSKRHKIRMNHLFRECVGGDFIPFPEVDNFLERARSKVIVKLRINELIERRKERRRKDK